MDKSSEPRRSLKARRRGSLLSPEATGGITAGKGFDFQTRYAACQLPVWLLQNGFHQLFIEGTGDIDIRFVEGGQSSRLHMQVKDHEVAPAEFKGVIGNFRKLDTGMPGIYKCFTLVCPSLAPKLRSIETGLSRFRNAKPFYDDAEHALVPTKEELADRFHKVGLDDDEISFIESKVLFEIGNGDLQHDDRAVEVFVARMLSHPDYAGMIRAMVQPAFAELLRGIEAKRGNILGRSDIEQILRSAIAAVTPDEKSVTVWVQNWTSETFDAPADYALDWSKYFDRSSRRVPSQELWNVQLLPELRSLKDKIVSERTERVIRFRGKCALSTGIMLGATFPAVGGWKFEIPQPPAKGPWRSDATPTEAYELRVELTDGDASGADLVLGLNIRGDGCEDVLRYVSSTGSIPKLFAFMAPSSTGSQAIRGSGDACAFAIAVRERLGQLLKTHHLRSTRLFFYGPFALSVFFGQQLTSVGQIHLFEYQDPGYVQSCSLGT